MKPARQLRVSLWPLEDMEAEAIQFIQRHESADGYFLGFSGGKDSIVTEHLCRLAGVQYQAGYSATGIDPPEVVQFIRKHYPDIPFYKPKLSMWRGIRKKHPPTVVRRWCCDTLKKEPTKHVGLPRIMGLRKEESGKRAGRPRVEWHYYFKQWLYKPIFHWTEWHIWEFIEKHGLEVPGLYDEGFHRLGCVVCPFFFRKNQGELRIHMNRWPQMYRVFEKVVTEWFDNRGKEDDRFANAREYLEAYYRGFEK